ncbi:MAG: DUF2188 domain-containing protein [Bacteroidetes bacterium]|nr:DUF2188 domain-containing protein [Bacteroidota bacterium]
MKILRLGFLAIFFSFTAFILSDQVLYRLWLVPQLPSFHKIPSYDYIIVLFPIILVIIVFGLVLSKWKQVFLTSLFFTVSHQIYTFVIASMEMYGYFFQYSLEKSFNFWILLSAVIFCMYVVSLGIVWYIKILIHKIYDRRVTAQTVRHKNSEEESDRDAGEDRIPNRVTYHVVPDHGGWDVKKEKAKKASSSHPKKGEALRAASDIAKSHPKSQVVVHDSSGVIKSDRTYEYRHYKKKKKKKDISKKIKKGLTRKKKEKNKERLKRRKAAKLGIIRMKRKQYLKRKSGKKPIRKKK